MGAPRSAPSLRASARAIVSVSWCAQRGPSGAPLYASLCLRSCTCRVAMVRRCRRRRRAHTCRSARPDASLRRKRLLGCEWGLGKTGVFIPAITALSASFASLASSVSLFTGFRICDLLGLVWDGERSPPRRLTPPRMPTPATTRQACRVAASLTRDRRCCTAATRCRAVVATPPAPAPGSCPGGSLAIC